MLNVECFSFQHTRPVQRRQKILFHAGEIFAGNRIARDKDKFNRVEFAPVATSALRMVITLQGKTYTKQPTPEAVRLGPPDANYMAEDVTWYEGGVIEWRVNRPAGI